MRFFTASPELLNQIRTLVMNSLEMPNSYADEPWPENNLAVAIGSHHYEVDDYASLISQAISMGAQEISEEEYRNIPQEQVFKSSIYIPDGLTDAQFNGIFTNQ